VLLVHYGDLKADLDGEMRRISAFLDIPVNEAIWPSLVEAATFEAMKRDGDSLLAGMERGFEGGHKSFLHKATNGRWQGAVDEADLARYRAKIEAALSPALIALARRRSRGGRGSVRLRRLSGRPSPRPRAGIVRLPLLQERPHALAEVLALGAEDLVAGPPWRWRLPARPRRWSG